MAHRFTHLPGRWELSGTGIWAISPWNARVRLAELMVFSPTNGIDWQANGRLIESAPALLSFATTMVDGVERGQVQLGGVMALADAMVDCRAALARIEAQP